MRCQCLNDSFATLSVARLEGVRKEMFIYRDFVFIYDHLVCRLQEFSVFLGLRVNPSKKDSPTNLRRRLNWMCMSRLYNEVLIKTENAEKILEAISKSFGARDVVNEPNRQAMTIVEKSAKNNSAWVKIDSRS